MTHLSLAQVIGDLRKELEQAITQAAEEELRFETGEISVELTVQVEAAGKAGIRFWVVDIGTDVSRTKTHTIKIPLKPVTKGGGKILTGGLPSPKSDFGR